MNKTLVLVCAVFLLGVAIGYVGGRMNILSYHFFDYTAKHSVLELSNGIPATKGTFTIAALFNEDGKGKNYSARTITVNVKDFKSIGGDYTGGDEISVASYNPYLIGHELCHLILYRYGIVDTEQNEKICYTIGADYDWNAEKRIDESANSTKAWIAQCDFDENCSRVCYEKPDIVYYGKEA